MLQLLGRAEKMAERRRPEVKMEYDARGGGVAPVWP
jgi:hypothetical protein